MSVRTVAATEPDPEDPVLHSVSTQSREDDARFVDAARAAVRVARVAANAVGTLDLTLAQYRVLVFVDGVDRTASEVARLLEVSPSTLTSVVDGLCARDFVERRSDPADGRRVVLTITDTGRDRVAAADRAVAEKLAALLGRLGPQRCGAALDGLDLLNDAMDDYVVEHFGRSS